MAGLVWKSFLLYYTLPCTLIFLSEWMKTSIDLFYVLFWSSLLVIDTSARASNQPPLKHFNHSTWGNQSEYYFDDPSWIDQGISFPSAPDQPAKDWRSLASSESTITIRSRKSTRTIPRPQKHGVVSKCVNNASPMEFATMRVYMQFVQPSSYWYGSVWPWVRIPYDGSGFAKPEKKRLQASVNLARLLRGWILGLDDTDEK